MSFWDVTPVVARTMMMQERFTRSLLAPQWSLEKRLSFPSEQKFKWNTGDVPPVFLFTTIQAPFPGPTHSNPTAGISWGVHTPPAFTLLWGLRQEPFSVWGCLKCCLICVCACMYVHPRACTCKGYIMTVYTTCWYNHLIHSVVRGSADTLLFISSL